MLYKSELYEFFENKNKVQVFLRDYCKEVSLCDFGEEGMVAEYEVISGNAKSSAISFDKLTAEDQMIGFGVEFFEDITKDSKIGSYHFAQDKIGNYHYLQGGEGLGMLLEERLAINDNYDSVIMRVEGEVSLIDTCEAASFVQERLGEEATVLFQGAYNETLGDTIHYHLWFF